MPEPEMPTPVSEISEIHETLLTPGQGTVPSPSAGGASTTTIFSLFFGLITGRQGASLTVRQNVAQQLNDWRENWGYSLAVVVLDTIWNVAFVVISVPILIWFAREEKNVQLRVWICGYSLQCVVHVVLVWLEYRRRNRTTRVTIAETLASTWSSFMDDDNDDTATGIATLIRRWDTEVHCIWLSFGLSLLSAYDHGAPNLFRLTVAYLAIDMFCVAIGLLLSSLLGLAYCFWLRWIIALMFFIRREEGALDADINILPRYKFVASNDEVEPARMVPVRTGSECVLLTEDVVDCCICLGLYEDGSNLHLLPCKHHFHSACILSWLMVKANCPICKRSIMQDE